VLDLRDRREVKATLNSLIVEAIQVVAVAVDNLLLGETMLRQECLEAKLKSMSRENVFTSSFSRRRDELRASGLQAS
jgi:hypothetical protein